MPNFIFLILLNTKLVLWSAWFLTVPNSTFFPLLSLPGTSLPHFAPLAKSFILRGSTHILSSPWYIPVHKDFFLELTFFSLIHSPIFSIYSHVVLTYSEYYTVEYLIFICFLWLGFSTDTVTNMKTWTVPFLLCAPVSCMALKTWYVLSKLVPDYKFCNCLERTLRELRNVKNKKKQTVVRTLKIVHYRLILVKIYSKRQENNNDYICTPVVNVAKYNPFPLRKLKRPAELSKIQNCQAEKQFADISNQRVSLLSHLLQA